MKSRVLKVLHYLVYSLMTVQIVMGMIWAVRNVRMVPGFGDTPEYISISANMKVDEYRTVFYPLIIKGAIFLQNHLGISYHYFMYALQSILCIAAIFYMWHYLYEKVLNQKGIIEEMIFSLYLFTIPMVLCHSFTILPDSIALSALLVALTQLVRIPREKSSIRNGVIFFIAVFIELAIRADRIYSFTIFVAAYSIIYLFKTKEFKKYIIVFGLMLLAMVSNLGINSVTQQKGYYGRIETSLPFILLDRVVYPHMTENYNDFSDELKEVVSIEDAQVFDSHNNHVMYTFAPMLQRKVGKEKAEEFYMEMASVVWKNEKVAVMGEILYKFGIMYFVPFFADSAMKGKVVTNFGWIFRNYAISSPKLTEIYFKYYNIGFGYIGLLLTVLLIIWGIKGADSRDKMKKWCKTLMPFFIMIFIICLWFAAGDGDTANHRYVLISYIMWPVFTAGLLFNFIELPGLNIYSSVSFSSSEKEL